jgi:hypothetical protein
MATWSGGKYTRKAQLNGKQDRAAKSSTGRRRTIHDVTVDVR